MRAWLRATAVAGVWVVPVEAGAQEMSPALVDGLAICVAASAGRDIFLQAADGAAWQLGPPSPGNLLYALEEGRKDYPPADGEDGLTSLLRVEFQTYLRRAVTFCSVVIPGYLEPVGPGPDGEAVLAAIGQSVGGAGTIVAGAGSLAGSWEGIEEGGGFFALARFDNDDLVFQITFQRPR